MATKKDAWEGIIEAMKTVYTSNTDAGKFTVLDVLVLGEIALQPGLTLTETMKKYADTVPLTTIQNSFVDLAKRDLIVKKPHPTDHKAKAIFLSREGEDLANSILKALKV